MDYLNKLIEDKDYQSAAGVCKRILKDQESWEEQIYRFLHLGQLHVSCGIINVDLKERL